MIARACRPTGAICSNDSKAKSHSSCRHSVRVARKVRAAEDKVRVKASVADKGTGAKVRAAVDAGAGKVADQAKAAGVRVEGRVAVAACSEV